MPKRNSVQQQHRPCNVLTKSFHLSGRSSGLESVPLWQWEPGEPQIYDYQYGFKSRDYHNETTISRVPVDSRFSGHTTLQTYCIHRTPYSLTNYVSVSVRNAAKEKILYLVWNSTLAPVALLNKIQLEEFDRAVWTLYLRIQIFRFRNFYKQLLG